jgi:citrate/tricarballylate utilization protein
MPTTEIFAEARQEMNICNACRYCEGFCAVFPAMERERAFTNADLTYLANLCHNCRGCYYACQYAPPHPFGVNVPQTLALLRDESYAAYAWPRPLARAFAANGVVVALVTAIALALVLLLSFGLTAPNVLVHAWTGPNAFYRVIPWGVMAGVAAVTLLFSVLALAIAGRRFWRDASASKAKATSAAVMRGLHDAFTLKNLGGGGHGCNDRDEAFSTARRRFHHAMFYGFLGCFAATVIAAFEAYFLGLPAPYPLLSAPVIFGTLGGIGLLVGTSGLVWLKITGDPALNARRLFNADLALLALLWLAGASGLALLAFRSTSAMGVLLALHLGIVLALFVLLPYSKFVHAVLRTLALIRNAADGTSPESTSV